MAEVWRCNGCGRELGSIHSANVNQCETCPPGTGRTTGMSHGAETRPVADVQMTGSRPASFGAVSIFGLLGVAVSLEVGLFLSMDFLAWPWRAAFALVVSGCTIFAVLRSGGLQNWIVGVASRIANHPRDPHQY